MSSIECPFPPELQLNLELQLQRRQISDSTSTSDLLVLCHVRLGSNELPGVLTVEIDSPDLNRLAPHL